MKTAWICTLVLLSYWEQLLAGPTGPLVSRGRPCVASSTHTGTTCAQTVDDNLSTSHPHCLHTGAGDTAPWVQIDLGKRMCLSWVEMITRQDCCAERLQNFKVFVKSEYATAGKDEEICHYHPDKAKPHEVIKFECTKCGRYVRVVNGIGPLQLCDLKVYARPTELLVSRKRPCTESSRHTTTTCALTVDDNLSTSHPHCLHTGANDPAPWVQIDLGKSVCLTRVEMITRQDCCPERLQNFKVFVKSDSAAAGTDADMCHHYPGKAKPNEVFKFACTKCGRYLRVVNGIGPLQLCDLKAYMPLGEPTDELVSSHKPCTESSRHIPTTCALTVDDNLSTSHPNCLHTGANDPAPWVQIDLGKTMCLTRVEMITRQDCCPERLQNFKVYVKTDSTAAGTDANMCYHYPGKATANEVFKFDCTKCGRYIRVTNGIGPLQLCDLKVYALRGPQCSIPFKYNGKTYHGCTKKDNGDTFWCSTTPEYDGKHKTCTATEVQSFEDNKHCAIPFTYGGVKYTKCTNNGDTKYWCSLDALYEGNYKYCTEAEKTRYGI